MKIDSLRMKYISRVFLIVLPLLLTMLTAFVYFVEPNIDSKFHELIILFALAITVAVLSVINSINKFIAPFEALSLALEGLQKGHFSHIDASKYPLVKTILENYNRTTNLLVLNEKSLQINNVRLRELDLKKTNFINVASHELRTPMTVIKWYVSMMIDGDFGKVDQEMLEYLNRIHTSTDLLLSLVNDMLDIAKMESDSMVFSHEKFEYAELVDRLLLETKKLADPKNIAISQMRDFEKLEICTDARNLSKVLENILENAIKFTLPGGKITVRSFLSNDDLHISIRDTGIGIDEGNLPFIFDNFSQIDDPLTRNIQGTWLWLSVSKKIMEALGWSITVESKKWVGTNVTVALRNYRCWDASPLGANALKCSRENE